MSSLKEVTSKELLDLYLAEQAGLLTETLLMSHRIHKAHQEMHRARIEHYVSLDDEYYDYYEGAEWVLFDAMFEIERQVQEQAEILEFSGTKYYLF